MVIADDEYIMVEGIKAIISRLKLQYEVVDFVYNGIEALNIIQDKRPGAVITDICTPGLDSLSLIESCKELLPEAYYMVISGYTEFEYARWAIILGVVDYIDEPVTMQKVMEALEEVEEKNNPPQYAYSRAVKETGRVVGLVMMGKADSLKGVMEHLLLILRENVPEFEQYHQEAYKIMSMLVQIFRESNPDVSCQITHYDMEKWRNPEECGEFCMNITRKMSEHLQSKRVGSSHRIIQKLLQFVDEKYANNIGLNEPATLVSMNPAYLSVPSHNEVGVTYMKYSADLRIKKTRELLDGGMKVMEVNEKVDYYNYRYFYEIFREHQGITPNEYKGYMRKRSQVDKNPDTDRQYV